MSKIDSQIKVLLEKKKKIEYVSYILDLLKNDTKCTDFLDIKSEIVSQIEPFLLKLSSSIEEGTNLIDLTESVSTFSQTEIIALKAIVTKLTSKTPDTSKSNLNKNTFSAEETVTKPKAELSTSEKMNFALANRHLAMKQVEVINDKNVKITGSVCGIDAPYIVVKTDTGPVISVELDKIVLIN